MKKNVSLDRHHYNQAMIAFRQALETTRPMTRCGASRQAHDLADHAYRQLLLARKLARERAAGGTALSSTSG